MQKKSWEKGEAVCLGIILADECKKNLVKK
jgi:hypothetical protein